MADPKQTSIEPLPTETESGGRNWLKIGLIAFAAVIVLLLLIIIYGAIADVGWILRVLAALRDFVIITLVLVGIAIAAILVIIVFKLNELISLLSKEIKPILLDARDTLHTVRGTATFISRNAVQPVIQVASFMAGVRTMVGELTTIGKSLRRPGTRSAKTVTVKSTDPIKDSKKSDR